MDDLIARYDDNNLPYETLYDIFVKKETSPMRGRKGMDNGTPGWNAGIDASAEGKCRTETVPSTPCPGPDPGGWGTVAYTWACSAKNVFSKSENDAGRQHIHPTVYENCYSGTAAAKVYPSICSTLYCYKKASASDKSLSLGLSLSLIEGQRCNRA